jgi:hypothetical protein
VSINNANVIFASLIVNTWSHPSQPVWDSHYPINVIIYKARLSMHDIDSVLILALILTLTKSDLTSNDLDQLDCLDDYDLRLPTRLLRSFTLVSISNSITSSPQLPYEVLPKCFRLLNYLKLYQLPRPSLAKMMLAILLRLPCSDIGRLRVPEQFLPQLALQRYPRFIMPFTDTIVLHPVTAMNAVSNGVFLSLLSVF